MLVYKRELVRFDQNLCFECTWALVVGCLSRSESKRICTKASLVRWKIMRSLPRTLRNSTYVRADRVRSRLYVVWCMGTIWRYDPKRALRHIPSAVDSRQYCAYGLVVCRQNPTSEYCLHPVALFLLPARSNRGVGCFSACVLLCENTQVVVAQATV